MRYILIILVFLSVGANAQMVIKAHANYRPYAQPAANLLLDDYPNAAAAYSLRKLDKDYTGAAIRVRKDTTGQPEQDIGFTASGDLDTAALKSFLNARSGFIVTWYDQSGNGRNATQSTASNQPRIANLGVIERNGGKVTIFSDDNDALNFTSITFQTSFSVARVQTQVIINYFLGASGNGLFYNGSFAGVDGIGGFDGTNLRTTTGEDLNRHLAYHNMRSSLLYVGRDGGAETNTGAFASSLSVTQLFNRPVGGGSLGLNGDMQELILYNSNQSSNRTGIESNINTYYGIY